MIMIMDDNDDTSLLAVNMLNHNKKQDHIDKLIYN